MIKIAVFASGEGTNLQALIDAAAAGRIRGKISLVVASSPEAGALKRAQRAGIPTEISHPRDFPTPEEYNAHLARLCKAREVGLICLAGFMLQVRGPLLKAFPWRIMNIHPALLPSFGGKGMYGRAVHEAVLKAGVRVTGCTVHLIDAEYDKGLVVWQSAAPVLAGDTPETLSARVRTQEHWAYPKAVSLFCEGRLQISDSGLKILPSPLDNSPRIKRALLTVADKTGLPEFARALSDLGVELVSTSGTGRALKEAGLTIRALDTLTGFPEILSGRVKTLHPSVHGAILFRRKDPGQSKEAQLLGIEPIDMVVVNLYPFAKTAAQAPSPFSPEVIDQIDIGGPALIRAAAKNFEHVAVLVSPQDYGGVIKELETSSGALGADTLRRLATSAFRHTAEYDRMISEAWSKVPASVGGGGISAPPPAPAPAPSLESGTAGGFPATLTVGLKKIQDLRYGENPHQRAALYSRDGVLSFKQLHGKELSYNNLLDANGVWEAVSEFSDPAAAIFKHVTPSGVGTGESLVQAVQRLPATRFRLRRGHRGQPPSTPKSPRSYQRFIESSSLPSSTRRPWLKKRPTCGSSSAGIPRPTTCLGGAWAPRSWPWSPTAQPSAPSWNARPKEPRARPRRTRCASPGSSASTSNPTPSSWPTPAAPSASARARCRAWTRSAWPGSNTRPTDGTTPRPISWSWPPTPFFPSRTESKPPPPSGSRRSSSPAARSRTARSSPAPTRKAWPWSLRA